MNGALWSLFDGQSSDFVSAPRSASSNQQTVFRTRRAFADVPRAPLLRARGRFRGRRRFYIKSSLDDESPASPDAPLTFREELVNFAKTAPTSPDQDSFYGLVHPQARSTMKYIISRMMGNLSYPILALQYSSLEEQLKTLITCLLITGYMIKKAQDRVFFDRQLEQPPDFSTPARTHGVTGDVILWNNEDRGPRSVPVREHIAALESYIKELEQRERKRYESGKLDELVDYMESLGEERLGELTNGASEEVLLAMHVCTTEFLGGGELNDSPMVHTLPHKEMCRLMEWLLTFGYALRCKEIKHEMEKAYLMELEEIPAE